MHAWRSKLIATAPAAPGLKLESIMATFNFSANAVDFGNWTADTQAEARERFAADSGYKSWADMVERADEFGGNAVEIRELMENGRLSGEVDAV